MFTIAGAIAIYRKDELFFGSVQYSLLRLIIEEGSINAAARQKGMAYQQAWNIIDRMNRLSPIPIVVRQKGGKSGGGCFVSEYGKQLIGFFEKKLDQFNDSITEINHDMDDCFI